jgi:hypothetical protein
MDATTPFAKRRRRSLAWSELILGICQRDIGYHLISFLAPSTASYIHPCSTRKKHPRAKNNQTTDGEVQMDARTPSSQDSLNGRAVVTAETTDCKQVGILRRIFDAFMLSRQRQVERDIERLLGRSGGRLNDEMERRISEHLIRNSNL